MKQTIAIASLLFFATSCMRKFEKITVGNDFASVAVINAAPSATGAATNTSGLVFVDNISQTGSAVAYRSSSGYMSVRPGARNFRYMATTADSARFAEFNGANFEAGKSYTYVFYDTIPAAQTGSARRLKSLRLTDDLSLSGKANNSAFVRVLNLASQAPALDVTFLRTNVATADSVTVTNINYVGNNPTQTQLDQLSRFNTILPLGFAGTYTIRVKLAGTQTLAIAPTTVALTTQTISQSFVTVYITGGAQGQPLTVNVFRHYP
jgi:hypothetical protein